MQQRALRERALIGWYNPETVDLTSHQFILQMKSLARTVRNSSLISLCLFHRNDLPRIVTPIAIADELITEHNDLFRLVNPMFLQAMAALLGESYIQNPRLFAKTLHDFFADDPSDLLFFAHVTFPSLFSFSYIPDLMENAVDLVMNLLYIDPGDITAHFASALYLNNPRFNDDLWTTFFREMRRKKNCTKVNKPKNYDYKINNTQNNIDNNDRNGNGYRISNNNESISIENKKNTNNGIAIGVNTNDINYENRNPDIRYFTINGNTFNESADFNIIRNVIEVNDRNKSMVENDGFENKDDINETHSDECESDCDEFDIFIEALGIACKHLSPMHSDLARKIFVIGRGVFSHIFIDFLFLPSLKLQLKCDRSANCFGEKCGLFDDFKSIRINPDCDKLSQIYDKMSTDEIPEQESLVYGGFTGVGLSYYPAYLSAYELRLIFNIINGSSNRHANVGKALERCKQQEFAVFKSGEIQIRKALTDLKRPPPPNIISESIPKPPAVEDNQEYLRLYSALEKYAKDHYLDVLCLIEPNLFSNYKITKVFPDFGIVQNSQKQNLKEEYGFTNFAISTLLNRTHKGFESFEKNLTFLQYKKTYSIVMQCAYPYFDKLLNQFIQIGESWPDEISYRLKLSSIKDVEEISIDKKRISTVDIVLCDKVNREMQKMRNEFESTVTNTSVSDQIQIIPLIIDEVCAVARSIGDELVLAKFLEVVLKSDFAGKFLATLKAFQEDLLQFLPAEKSAYARWLTDSWQKVGNVVKKLLPQ